MSDVESQIPSIGNLDGVTDPAIKKILMAIKETLEIREGTRPRTSPLDKSVTFRDLLNANVVSVDVNGDYTPSTGGTSTTGTGGGSTGGSDTTIPGTPLGLIASGTKLAVLLEWDSPFGNIAYTEIHRADVDDVGQAVLIGTSNNTLYGDIIGETGLTFYYWIRFVSKAELVGGFNSISGTVATTGKLSSNDLISVDGAKIIDATILDAKIGTVSADKIRTGTLQVGQAIQVGIATNRIFIDGNGIIRSGGMQDYLNGSGFWTGVTGGVSKFSVGNSSKYVAWDGANLFIQGNNFSLTDTELIFNGNGTFNGNGNFSGALVAASGTFAGALQAATGSFSGNLNAATGTFGGQLLAGVIDPTSLQGESSIYLAPGVYTLTVPVGKTTMRASLAGGSGGGGGAGNINGTGGGGGGSSGLYILTFSGLVEGATYTLTVGSRGLKGLRAPASGDYLNFGTNGTDGGNTIIAGLATCTGGKGGGRGGPATEPSGTLGGLGGLGGTSGSRGNDGGGLATGGNQFLNEPLISNGQGGLGGTSIAGAVGGRGGDARTFDDNAENGQNGFAYIEFFNPNSVVLRTDYNILLSALTRQGIDIV